MTGPIDDAVRVGDGQAPDILDEIVSETRDYTPEQCQARLAELGRFTRLSGRQRVEQSLLAERVQTAQTVMAAYRSGNLAAMSDGGQFAAPNVAPGTPPAGHGGWATAQGLGRHVQAHRTAAMRVLDRCKGTGLLGAAAADRADKVLRHGDGQALTARYLAAVGDPDYASAFGKMVGDPMQGHLRFSPAEVEAVREATAAQDATRIMGAALTTQTTGFPLPITIDPSIVITGAGALNPIRDISNVVTVGTHDWQGVTSDSVTASYVQEGVEATDATPALAGPKISTQQGRAFARFSLESSQDWGTLQNELLKMVADARNVVDATMFLSGNGTNQPYGILGGNATYSLTTTQRVQTNTVATYVVGDPWLLKAGIPARFINTCTFAAAPGTWDTTYRFVAQGSTTEPRQFSDGDRGGDFLGRPKVEWSTMATGATTGTKLIIGGDFRTGFKIVDRLGMSAELIPHLFGVTAQLPVGQRGLYCWWRTGAAVIAQNALRFLEVK